MGDGFAAVIFCLKKPNTSEYARPCFSGNVSETETAQLCPPLICVILNWVIFFVRCADLAPLELLGTDRCRQMDHVKVGLTPVLAFNNLWRQIHMFLNILEFREENNKKYLEQNCFGNVVSDLWKKGLKYM